MSTVDKYSNLSDTIFRGRVTDEILAVEAYKVVDNSKIISNFKSKGMLNSEVIDKVISRAKEVDLKKVLKKAEKLKEQIDNLRNLDLEEIKKDVLGQMTKYGASFIDSKEFPFLAKMNEHGITTESLLNGEAVNNVKLFIDDTKEYFHGDNFKDAQSIAGFMNKVFGNDSVIKFIDLREEMAFIGDIVGMAIKLGVPGLVDVAMKNASSPEVVVELWARTAAEAIHSSDLTTLNRALDNTTVGEVRKYISNPLRSLLMTYSSRGQLYDYNKTTEANLFLSTLERLESGWDKKVVNGKFISNLSAYQICSLDALGLFVVLDTHRAKAVCGNKTGLKSVSQILRSLYPDILITND